MKIYAVFKEFFAKIGKADDRSALVKEWGPQATPLQVNIEVELEKQRLKHIQYMGRRSF